MSRRIVNFADRNKRRSLPTMKKMNALLMAALFCCSPLFAEDWMQRLPDSVYVAVLSIPGAHDAATGSGWEEGMEGLGDA